MKNKEEQKKLKVIETSNYNSLFISTQVENEPASSFRGSLGELLSNPAHRLLKDEVLRDIKEKHGKKLLLEAIRECKVPLHLSFLVAACWETGMDFSPELSYFVELALRSDTLVALECLTVIEQSETVTVKTGLSALASSCRKASLSATPEKKFIFDQIATHLELPDRKNP